MSEDPVEHLPLIENKSITLEEAYLWLNRIRPQEILSFLKQPENILILTKTFLGFRVNPTSYANTLVRSRLAAEITQNNEFAEKIKELFDKYQHNFPIQEQAEPKPLEQNGNTAKYEEIISQEREKRKKVQKESKLLHEHNQSTINSLKSELEQTRLYLLQIEQERNELKSRDSITAKRISKLEKQIQHLNNERRLLIQNAKANNEESALSESCKQNDKLYGQEQILQVKKEQAKLFETAIIHLIDKGGLETGISIAKDILKEDKNNITALTILRYAYSKTDKKLEALHAAYKLVIASIEQNDFIKATDGILALYKLNHKVQNIGSITSVFLKSLSSGKTQDIEYFSKSLDRIKHKNHEAWQQLYTQVQNEAPTPVKFAVLKKSMQVSGRSYLPLKINHHLTAEKVIEAIDTGNIDLITKIRKELTGLKVSNTDEYNKSIDLIKAITNGDESYLVPLLHTPKGAIIMDANNVVWHDRNEEIADRPRLSAIMQLRRTLRLRGYFPVNIIGDASLPHIIDEKANLVDMISRGEIRLVDIGTDADEIIIREAKRLHSPIATNDYMTDWDPDNTLEKIRFIIPATGNAYLLNA